MYGIQIPKHDTEGRVLTAEYDKFYLVGVYVPNAGEKLKRVEYRTNEWDRDFRGYLEALEKEKPVILAGDLNVGHQEIDIYDPKGKHKSPGFSPQERANFTEFLKSGWVDTFRAFYPETVKYSFWSMRFGNLRPRNMGWRLDYFVVSENFLKYCEDSLIHNEYFGSDHCPVQLKVNFNHIPQTDGQNAGFVETTSTKDNTDDKGTKSSTSPAKKRD